MFVALKDLRYARGRFALMFTVIVLVALLVGFLAALTGGLSRESTSAIVDLPAQQLAFSTAEGAAPDFTTSTVTEAQLAQWGRTAGIDRVEPLGIATTRAATDARTTTVTTFGVDVDSGLVPGGHRVAPGTVVLSEPASAALGDASTIMIGSQRLTVAGTSDTDDSFSHTPVVWMNLGDWQRSGGAPGEGVATVVALWGKPQDGVPGMTIANPSDARAAIGSYSSENGSLRTITVFLVVISALVIGAFFTVWTIGRSGDIAVLKALGAGNGYLLRDAVGQAAIVLVAGTATGTLLAAAAAALLQGTLPVALDPVTLAVPALLLIVAGLVGAAASVWRITRIDPHAALAAR